LIRKEGYEMLILFVKELITDCWVNGVPGVGIYNVHGAREILNPIRNYTYDFLEAFYKEIKNTFPYDYIHMGMDEGKAFFLGLKGAQMGTRL
jgi:hypothetical protein